MELSSLKNKKIGLVLSGGVVKAAAWHLGVSNVLWDHQISTKTNAPYKIDCLVGSSAGAMIGSYLISGFTPEEVLESFLKKDNRKLPPIRYRDIFHVNSPLRQVRRFLGGINFSKTLKNWPAALNSVDGFFNTKKLERYLKSYVLQFNTFSESPTPFFVTATPLLKNMQTVFGPFEKYLEEEGVSYQNDASISQAISASMSVPVIFEPQEINGHKYVDGEVRKSLSSHIALKQKCDVIISSWTYSCLTPQNTSIVSGIPYITYQSITHLVEEKIYAERLSIKQQYRLVQDFKKFLQENKIPQTTCDLFQEKMQREWGIDNIPLFIDIFPDRNDDTIFKMQYFSLNQKIIETIAEKAREQTEKILKTLG